MVHSFQYDFELDAHVKDSRTQYKPGKLLLKGENKVTVSNEDQKTYISGVGKKII